MSDRSKVRYAENIVDTIGNTPLVRLNAVARGVRPLVLAKVESFNPGGSVKDRIGYHIVDAAEREGLLEAGGTIVEATSGNTGCGLAMVAATRGYRAIFTMPDKMSQEKINLLKAYGADVHVAPTAVAPDHPDSYYEVAKRLAREIPGAFLANQYFNPANPRSHVVTTGPELWEQTGGELDVFVAGMGTGGTISGVGQYLKERKPSVSVVGADPDGSILCHYFETGQMIEARTYKTEGVGEDIIPGTTNFDVIDRVVTVTDKEALNMARRVSREDGILIGGSGGMAVVAALKIAAELDESKIIVVLLPDTGERYLSKVHSDEWMRDNCLLDVHDVSVQDVLGGKPESVPGLLKVAKDDPVRAALDLVRNYNVSQLPVMDGERVVGCVEETQLMSRVLENAGALDEPVSSVMSAPLPVIEAGSSVVEALQFLADRNAVLVRENGGACGILTRFDLIEYVTS